MSTEPVMSKISLNTPASVRTRPLPALTRNTAAMLSRNATMAFEIRISGLQGRSSKSDEYMRCIAVVNAPEAHDLIERRETLCEWKHSEVDERAHRCVVVQGHEWVHLQAVQKDLNHHQPRGLELFAQLSTMPGYK